MIFYLFFILFSYLFCKIIIEFSIKYNFAVDSNFDKPQSIHSKQTPRVLGLSFFIMYILTHLFFELDPLIRTFIFSALFVASIGIIEDFNLNINPVLRFFIQILSLIFIFFLSPDINALNSVSFLPSYFENDYFKLIFSIFAIITILNSFNFMDGLNGFVIIYSIVISFFLIISINDKDLIILFFLLILNLLVILFFNFPQSKAFLGDFGSYFLGLLFSIVFIYIDNNQIIEKNLSSSWFLANLLAYPAFEIFSTVTRRLLLKKSPFYPDNLHLHSILNKTITIKFNIDKNYISTIILIIIIVINLLPLFFMKNSTFMYLFFFQFLVFYFIRYLLINYNK